MRKPTILLILILYLMQWPVHAQDSISISAQWLDEHRAVVSWQQPPGVRLTCVYRQPKGSGGGYFLGCLENLPTGAVHFEMPGPPPADYTRWPAPGDVIIVKLDGVDAGRVQLPERYRVYLPVIAKG